MKISNEHERAGQPSPSTALINCHHRCGSLERTSGRSSETTKFIEWSLQLLPCVEMRFIWKIVLYIIVLVLIDTHMDVLWDINVVCGEDVPVYRTAGKNGWLCTKRKEYNCNSWMKLSILVRSLGWKSWKFGENWLVYSFCCINASYKGSRLVSDTCTDRQTTVTLVQVYKCMRRALMMPRYHEVAFWIT